MKSKDNACTVLYRNDWEGPSFNQGSMLPQDSKVQIAERMGEWLFVAGHDRVLSARPVQITLRQEDSLYFAECERLHIYAHGDSRDDAIDSLHQQVIYFFKHYSEIAEDNVTGEAAELRKLYIENFSLTS